MKGKSADTFGPIGPWLVTADEVPNPQGLDMWLKIENGKRYQNGSTKTMIFGVAFLVSFLSRFMSLQPGDIITTGTPPGVGMGQKPSPIYLHPGQPHGARRRRARRAAPDGARGQLAQRSRSQRSADQPAVGERPGEAAGEHNHRGYPGAIAIGSASHAAA